MRYFLQCLICKQPKPTCTCPSLLAFQQQHARSGQTRKQDDLKPAALCASAHNEPYAAFKRDKTAMLHEPPSSDELLPRQEPLPHNESASQSGSPLQVIKIALPVLREKSTPGTQRMQFFLLLGALKILPMWILADSGSL